MLTAQPASVDLGFVNIFTKGHAKGTAMGAAFGAALPELVVPIMLALSASNAKGGSQPPSNISTLTLNLEPAAEALGWPQVVAVSGHGGRARTWERGQRGQGPLASRGAPRKGLCACARHLESKHALLRAVACGGTALSTREQYSSTAPTLAAHARDSRVSRRPVHERPRAGCDGVRRSGRLGPVKRVLHTGLA